jgi:hypothetical protein
MRIITMAHLFQKIEYYLRQIKDSNFSILEKYKIRCIKISTIKKPLNRQADKFDGQIFSMGFKSTSILRMIEWSQSKLSEQLHSIMEEPQTTACGHYFRMGKSKIISLSKNMTWKR